MESLPTFVALIEHLGGLRPGMLVLVAGDLSFPFHVAFTDAVLQFYPSAVISGRELIGPRGCTLRELKMVAKSKNLLFIIMYDSGSEMSLKRLRAGIGDCDPDLILFPRTGLPPFEIEIAKHRGGQWGKVVVQDNEG